MHRDPAPCRNDIRLGPSLTKWELRNTPMLGTHGSGANPMVQTVQAFHRILLLPLFSNTLHVAAGEHFVHSMEVLERTILVMHKLSWRT